MIEELVLGDDAIGVAGEIVEHAERLRREPDRPVAIPEHLRPRIQPIGGEVHDRTDGHASLGFYRRSCRTLVSRSACSRKATFTADFTRALTPFHDGAPFVE